MLSSRLPTERIARLLLGLLLVCNLTLCISWHAAPIAQPVALQMSHDAMNHGFTGADHGAPPHSSTLMADADHPAPPLGCHAVSGDQSPHDECQLQSVVGDTLSLLLALLPLLALPLLLWFGQRALPQRLGLWLRNPFLWEQRCHPPSWPRRHLMLSVLRH
jgi:hypothetical protein